MVTTEYKKAYLAFGANLGDKEQNILKAINLIDGNSSCKIDAVSSLYLTKPMGPQDQPDYLNAVAEVSTMLSPYELLELCNLIEEIIGRKRTIRWGPRVIDIDILLYNSEQVSESDLVIPHPGMMERAFVLVPLAEIAPDLKLINGLTAKEAVNLVDTTSIKLLDKDS